VWGPCRGILYFMPLSESKSTRTVVSNAVECLCHVDDETVGIIN